MSEVSDFAESARNESSAGLQSNYMGGTEAARGLLNQPDTFSRGLGGSDSATQAAIRSKMSQGFARSQNHLSIDTLKNANQDHLKKLEVATQMAAEEQSMNLQKEILRKKQKQAQAAMRGQLIGTVLGIAGGVGGAMIPGAGAAGAMAGYQLGSGAGNAIGSGL